MRPKSNIQQRFWKNIDPCRTDGCMLWVGKTTTGGYAQFHAEDRAIRAHAFLVGLAPEGLQWDHLCRVKTCVNPDHLEAVTPLENIRRMAVLRTHCKRGHEYIGEIGSRNCPECKHETYLARRGPALRSDTHCKKGHPFGYVNESGHRICRVCKQESQVRRRLALAVGRPSERIIDPI